MNKIKLLNALKQFLDVTVKIDVALNDVILYAALSKLFETAIEYCWKYFKSIAEAEGYDVQSPRDAIRYAAKLNIIDNLELWLQFLTDRNHAVHDYFGLPPAEYLKTMKAFAFEVAKLKLQIESNS